jgi:ribosomal protein L20A (L18A)
MEELLISPKTELEKILRKKIDAVKTVFSGLPSRRVKSDQINIQDVVDVKLDSILYQPAKRGWRLG